MINENSHLGKFVGLHYTFWPGYEVWTSILCLKAYCGGRCPMLPSFTSENCVVFTVLCQTVSRCFHIEFPEHEIGLLCLTLRLAASPETWENSLFFQVSDEAKRRNIRHK